MKITKKRSLVAGSAAAATFIIYLAALQNDFVDWDDGAYVYENLHIQSLNAGFWRWAFLDFYASNWHPLTWLSHAADYALWGLNPQGHHLTNIFLHSLNTCLVALLVIGLLDAFRERSAAVPRLSQFNEKNTLLATGITALLFGLHPLHVESVAWIAERKDLLCGLFFLLTIITYLRYSENDRAEPVRLTVISRFFSKQYLVPFTLFVLALMSKPMAVTLPAVLLILDWYPLNRISTVPSFRRAVGEKIPFIATSLLSSVVTVAAQSSGGAIQSTTVVPLLDRFFVAAQSLLAYLWKMIWPLHLVPFYPYPADGMFSLKNISLVLLVTGMTAACIWRVARKEKLWLAAWGYYVVTLLPVLGIVQVGAQSMADRYTYLPSIGPFLVFGLSVSLLAANLKRVRRPGIFKTVGMAIAIVAVVFLSRLTLDQIGIWRNTLVFWNYIIEIEPQVDFAYNNRGIYFEKHGRPDLAIMDYDKAISLNPLNFQAYNNRGVFLSQIGQYEKAISDFTKTIYVNSSYFEAFFNRGVAFENLGAIDKAMADYDAALSLNPSNYNAYLRRASILEKKGEIERAIRDYSATISLHPGNYDAYVGRARLLEKTGQLDLAIVDYNAAISVNSFYRTAFYNRAAVFEKLGYLERAIADCGMALAISPDFVDALLMRGHIFARTGRVGEGLVDFNNAILLDENNAAAYLNRGKTYLMAGDRDRARADLRHACRLGINDACKVLLQGLQNEQ